MRVAEEAGKFLLYTHYDEKLRAHAVGGKWNDDRRRWEVTANILSAAQILTQAKPGEDVEAARVFLRRWDAPAPLVIPSTKEPMMPHQVKGCSELLFRKRYLLTFEMGCGKTLAVIGAAQELFKESKLDLLLIIVPLSVFGSWERQFNRFCNVPFTVMKFMGDREKRAERMEDVEVLRVALRKKRLIAGLINYEAIRLFADDLIRLKPNMVAMDESTYLANRTAQMTKAARRVARSAEYATALTGTPIKNNVCDIFGQAQAVSSEFFGDDYWHYAREFALFGGFKNKEIVGSRNLKGLDWIMKKISLRVRKEDVLELPERTWDTRDIYLAGEQKEAYEKAEKDFYFAVEAVKKHIADRGDEERSIVTVLIKNALSRLLRCQQIASGHCKTDEGETILWPGNPKILELVNLVQEAGEQRVVVFSRFVEDLLQGQIALREAGFQAEVYYGDVKQKDRQRIEDEFLKDESPLKVVLAQVKTGGFGVDFSKASICIFFNNWFSWSVRDQAESRLHRLGQTRKVTIYDLIGKGTVDEVVLETVLSKKSLSETLFGRPMAVADDALTEFGASEGFEISDEAVNRIKGDIEKMLSKSK
jgi:SNF2 family DNA or RNA helicase